MEARELRIGNWVDDAENGLCRLTSVNEDDSAYCEAIKLTEEWLLKFGIGKESFFINGTEFSIKDNIAFLNFGYMELCEVKYVHQLQNLYFALTGKELTIK